MKKSNIKIKEKNREIVIYTEEEKLLRSNISKELCANIEFPSCVYSYVKGKSAKDAVNKIRDKIDDYKYFIKYDIKDFFYSINLNILKGIIEERISDRILQEKIINIINNDAIKLNINGLILGSPLSNHLSNLYLINIDEKYGRNKKIDYYRFCDDIFILYNDQDDIEELIDDLKEYELFINNDKVVSSEKVDTVIFLGEEIKKKNIFFGECITEEEVIEMFRKIKNSPDEINKLKEAIQDELGKEFLYAFKYYFLKEDKEMLVEELLENKLYNEVYLFEDLVEMLDSEKNIFTVLKSLFIYNDEFYYKSKVIDGKLEYEIVNDKVREDIINNHIIGDESIAVNLNKRNKSKVLVIDIDKKSNLKKAYNIGVQIQKELENRGVYSYLEFSGNKGYHLWIFFDQYVSIEKLNEFIKHILNDININLSNVEIIPKYNKISSSQDIIKLPLGKHPISNKKSYFLDLDSLENIIINHYEDYNENINLFWKSVKEDYEESYLVANKCSIIKNIIEYGIMKKNIPHNNRLVLSYIFPKLENGNNFLHFLMDQLNNYSYFITEKYIKKSPDNPISCKKLKEYFKDTEFKCSNCSFKHNGLYNSPILHCSNNENIIQSSKNHIKNIVDELIKLQQEKKNIINNITKAEKKLSALYEELGEESIDIPLGKLNKKDDKWIIEIDL